MIYFIFSATDIVGPAGTTPNGDCMDSLSSFFNRVERQDPPFFRLVIITAMYINTYSLGPAFSTSIIHHSVQ